MRIRGIVQSGVRKQTSTMYEMWKKKQIQKDARKMYRTETPVKKFGKMEKAPFWEVITWSEEWTGRERV